MKIRRLTNWSRATKRYLLVSIVLFGYATFKNDMLPMDLGGWLVFPILALFFVPGLMLTLAVIVYIADEFIHWLEDDRKPAWKP